MLTSFKQTLKQFLPATIVKQISSLQSSIRLLLSPRAMRLHREIARSRKAFEEWNRNPPPNTVILRPGLQIGVAEGGFDTLIPFAWGTAHQVRELDNFLVLTRGCKCLFDIGAFHGIFSMVFCASTSGTAYSFEPSPAAWPMLKANFERNPKLSIHPNCIAIGNQEGELTMHYEWKHLAATPVSSSAPSESGMKIPMATLDVFCDSRGIIPDVVKIDVEGFEFHVLQGGQNVFRRCRPLMFMEVHKSPLAAHGIALTQLWQLLHDFGYEIYDAAGPLIRAGVEMESTNPSNIICRPSSSMPSAEVALRSRGVTG